MVTDWLVQEFGVRENGKYVSVESLEARRAEVVGHDEVTWRLCGPWNFEVT
jgi:hypothetical protein